MGLRGVIVLVGLMGTTWSFNATTIRPEAVSTDTLARPETTEETTEQGRSNPGLMNEDRAVHVTALTDTSGGVDSQTTEGTVGCSKKGAVAEEEAVEDVMATGELNPSHYPAQRAAKVVQHYLNTRYGSPYKLFGLKQVHSGNAEDVADSGRKYQLDISVHEIISDTKENCSAEVFFPRGVKQLSPQVQVSSCEELLKIDANSEEEALYQQYKTNKTLRTEKRLPDSYGHIDPEMTPFWHLGIVASSFIMLNESTENTLYNVAQVANITQLTTENDQLKFDCHVLLHDMVSQEIPQWKLLFTWSPAGGVKVLHTEQLPHLHDCEKHPKTN